MSSGGGGGGGGGAVMRSPFTVSQWQELEHQALIYKYMMAGLPVPPDLVLPIQKSFDSISPSFFHHPSLGYCSFYGKKVDPEPGRCRRTDGKKWRCSKDAYPDSKYCERHMHRGRNRSRKPVESSSSQQTIITQSAVTPGTVIDANSGIGSFHNHHHHAFGNPVSGSNQSQYHHLDAIPYAIPSKDYRMKCLISSRYLQGVKAEASTDRGNFVSNNNNEDSSWPLMQSRVSSSSFSTSKSTNPMNDYPSTNQPFLDFPSSAGEPAGNQSLRPFFDEWPKTRGAGGGGDSSRSNTSFSSTTQLSISIPTTMASSPDMLSTSSRSSPSES
ncbi:Growth-regulating factor 4 [Linum perenne]